ncbi:hypothetical protein N7488_002603 [Penicillium malachiteum]|nr:hypothetical protein N7488_002603 [Penicillium malachiteum]
MSCLSTPGDRPIARPKPKLTLQTSSLPRTFGTSTTGLSRPFTTAPGTSPTVRNTFKNAYDVPSPTSATTSPSKGPSHRFPTDKAISPYVYHPINNNNFNHRSAYQQPLGVRSILRNSPLDTASRRRSGSISAGAGGPAGAGTRRVFFPAKKQVSYRQPLEEIIHTERYTAQHLDIIHEAEERKEQEKERTQSEAVSETGLGPEQQVPAESTDDSDSSQSSTSDEASTDENKPKSTLSKLERKKRRTMRTERQVRAVALLDDLDSDHYTASSTPQTPRQGRIKRRREWKWTLGPIQSSLDNTSPQSLSSVSTTPETPSISSASTVDDVKPDLPICQQEQ